METFVIGLLVIAFVGTGIAWPKSPHGIVGRILWGKLRGQSEDYKARNAIVNYKAALDRTAKEVGQTIETAGGNYEALIRSNERKAAHMRDEIARVEGRLKALRDAGEPPSNPAAQRNGLLLLDLKRQLEDAEAKIERYEAARTSIKNRLATQGAKVISGREKAVELEAELQESELERQATAGIAGLGSGEDSLGEAEDLVRARIDHNRGVAALSADVFGENAEDAALDQKASNAGVDKLLAERWGSTSAAAV